MSLINERLARVRDQIADAAASAGRNPAEITLIGVTKTWPVETLVEAYQAGLRDFGENRTHELAEKRPAFAASPTYRVNDPVRWHFIGHLQSRQSQVVAGQADCFHAADRLKILRRLDKQLEGTGRTLEVLLEVNISGEKTKGGFPADRWEQDAGQLAALKEAVHLADQSPVMTVTGLMTMAPWGASEAVLRSVFIRTRQLRDWLAVYFGRPLPMLSMGMSDDYEIAIAEGATHVRIGRAIFGERN